jgi:hypothetical protein
VATGPGEIVPPRIADETPAVTVDVGGRQSCGGQVVEESMEVSPTADPRRLRAPDGRLLAPPPGWVFLEAGDAALTRRVKAAGPSWTVVTRRGRRRFALGVWAPAAGVESARQRLAAERASPAHARKKEADARRRAAAQAGYVAEFEQEVLGFLAFSAVYADLGRRLAQAVTRHATPVGSGTVARTKRLTVARRAEAAVIAWLRHQTTAYEQMKIPRIKGKRREVRQLLAETSRHLLDRHRRGEVHEAAGCALCRALAG